MTSDSRLHLGSILLATVLALSLVTAPASAQEQDDADEDEISRAGRVFFELSSWVAQGTGQNYFPATYQASSDPFDTRVIELKHGTENSLRSRFGYEFTKQAGMLVLTYFGHRDRVGEELLRPGDFIFGEILAPPAFAGAFDDGLADGFRSAAVTKLRDLRIDFFRSAVRSSKFNADWFVGVRRVQYQRALRTEYFGILPDFGPILPYPTASLPLPDVVDSVSDFNGRGLEAGFEATLPLYKDRLMLEGSLSVTALRGKVDSVYRATTSYYADAASGTILAANAVPAAVAAGTAVQVTVADGLRANSVSLSGLVEEVSFGLRYRAWRKLAFFVGFRDTRYGDVALDLRPGPVTTVNGTNDQSVAETRRSTTYEGVYFGAYYSF